MLMYVYRYAFRFVFSRNIMNNVWSKSLPFSQVTAMCIHFPNSAPQFFSRTVFFNIVSLNVFPMLTRNLSTSLTAYAISVGSLSITYQQKSVIRVSILSVRDTENSLLYKYK